MAHIVPIDRSKSLRIFSAEQAPRDPFDVVVFLNHFLEVDRYPDAIISHISSPRDAAPVATGQPKSAARHHLTMQLGQQNLVFSLGRG